MMNHIRPRLLLSLCFMCLLFVCSQCGTKDQSMAVTAADCLPHALGEETSRAGEVRVFAGESLWEYINGDAELYQQYGFVEVATADYKRNEMEFVADVYRFTGSVNAYGLYTAVRPDQPIELNIGVTGFTTGTAVTLVKGEIVVHLISFVASDAAEVALREMAMELASMIPGTTAPPATFGRFPIESVIAATDRIYGASFQGQSFLTEFFSQKYEIKGDTVELFLSEQSAEDKLNLWIASNSQIVDTNTDLAGLSFDSDRNVALQSFYGPVIAGLKAGYLVGMINYSEDKREFLENWLSGLTE